MTSETPVTWKKNLERFRCNFPDLVDLAEEWKSDLPKIVFIGKRNESAVRNLIECICGFAVDLNHIKNPVEYRLLNDDACEDDEVFCTVGESQVEIDLPTEYDLLVQWVNRYSNWVIEDDDYLPIIVEIRAKGLKKVDIIDLPLSCTNGMFDSLGSAKVHPIIAITVGVAECDSVPASLE